MRPSFPHPKKCPLCGEPLELGQARYTGHRLGVVHYDCHKAEETEAHERRTADLACVLYFLHGARRDGLMYNSHTAREAFSALCRLQKVDEAQAIIKMGGFA